jgi:hypothetical protein
MGWLKKLTKPISKVLDKIIPNEIKPALPYLSAFAPYMLPAGMAGGSGIGALLRRGALTGGINIASQLAQEGSEGEFSGLSALLAAGQGALTAPGAADTLKGMQVSGVDQAGNLVRAGNLPVDLEAANALNLSSDIGTLGKLQNVGLKGATKAAEFLTGAGETIRDPSAWGMNKETLGAFATPITQGTADLAMADARRALNDYNAGLEEGSDAWYDDNARRVAIRSAMEAAGHVEETILDALASLGLKDGGRVGRAGGGMMSVLPKGTEMDYRGGGMIPMGSKERADDVPARLSKNEFVMTADAVRAAGGGSVNRGAKRMYDLMHNLEARV